MTATDTKTNQYWTGCANAGPQPLTTYISHIEYGGNVVDGQTQDVSVGQQIPLVADYCPADMTLEWNVEGANVVKNYAPLAGQAWTDSGESSPNPSATSTPYTEPKWTANITSVKAQQITDIWCQQEVQ